MSVRLDPESLLVLLGPRPRRGLGRWVEEGVRTAILTGRLDAGTALPSGRDVAATLAVARGTVTSALDLLVGDGLLLSRPRSALVVAPVAAAPSDTAHRAAGGRTVRPPSVGTPDPSLFPRAAWLRAVRAATSTLPDADLGYPDPQGLLALREALAAHLRAARGARVRARDVVVVSGVAQGITLLAEILAERSTGSASRRVVVEEPSSPGAVDLLRAAGLGTVPVPVDDHGLRVDDLPDAAAALVTPAHQFPLGAVLAPQRRRALVAWAAAGRYVLEDDYDAELRYDRRPVAALQAMDPERVVLLGSVSKLLSPALRLGWVVAPPALVDPLVRAKARADLGCSVPEQAALAALLDGGAYGRHVRGVRATYRRRRGVLLAALAEHAPGLRVRGVDAGLHVVVELGSQAAETSAVEALGARGVPVLPLGSTYAGRPRHGVVLGTARLREEQLEVVGRTLRAVAPRAPART
ncbi:MocR-like pyridoxine biosynthesis transcription factor PdxR [Cellulosimicrobium marinum]|uniref:MocR-like pyridoxine biosynthesis transcription factor PdxR n=1 Tax=Cellulosimicrobium marinum TaxID=1638992 RepID=UPI001E3E936A|nr:PLP-dependent aminotransferase family protein [Cellulosimicrobium marinum]MCB7138181.1 PLP-dependent aminotransferase family protein [Cellulosimicrobium marinum]